MNKLIVIYQYLLKVLNCYIAEFTCKLPFKVPLFCLISLFN